MSKVQFFLKKVVFLYCIFKFTTACNAQNFNEVIPSQPLLLNSKDITKVSLSKAYPPIDLKEHPAVKSLEDLTVNITGNHIEVKIYSVDSRSNKTLHTLTGNLNNFGEAYLNNSNYKKLKATLLCIDTVACNRLVVDFYLLPFKKRIRQFIVEFHYDSSTKNTNRTLNTYPPKEDPEYVKDDIIIEMAASESIHQDDNISSIGYIGIKPDRHFFQKKISETPTQPVQNDQSKSLPKNLVNTFFDPSGGEAIDYYSKGKIYNASKIPKEGEGFIKVNRSGGKNYAAGLLIDFLGKMSKAYIEKYPDNLLFINNLSLKDGGSVRPHKSHQNGLDVDVSYLPGQLWQLSSVISNRKGQVIHNGPLRLSSKYKTHKDFNFKRNFDFFKQMVDTGLVSRIFVNHNLKRDFCRWGKTQGESFISQNAEVFRRLRAVSHHHDHFHLRIKCHEYKRCDAQEEPPKAHGC